MIAKAGAAFMLVMILAAGLIIATVVGAVSGSNAEADPGQCVPVPPGELASGKVPEEYRGDVSAASKVSGIPAAMLAAQLDAESGWDPKAKSSAGARGIAQFMPGTWEQYAPGEDPFDPHAGIAAQGEYMGELYQRAKKAGYPGDPLDLAFAGYNAGWGAVQVAGGIPNFPETRNYVIRIRALAVEYTDADAAPTVPPEEAAECDVSVDPPGEGDDYPFRDMPHCILNPNGSSAGCPDGSISEFGAYHRECVDFVLWRLNQQFGVTSAPWKITNANFRPDGAVMGNAADYLSAWENKGWPTGTAPKVGAVTFYASGHPLTGNQPFGHVGIVKEVLPDGTFVEEGYNFGLPPDDHNYYTTVRQNTDPSRFLYVPKP